MLYSLILIVVMASTAGPIDVQWVLPNLPLAVCQVIADESMLESNALQGKTYQATAICVKQEETL